MEVPRENEDALVHGNNDVGVIRCSNFSIDEILKPTFGIRKNPGISDNLFSAFSPVLSGTRLIPTSGLNLNFDRSKDSSNRLSTESRSSTCSSPDSSPSITSPTVCSPDSDSKSLFPAWVYCTRYSDRPSSGPRSRKIKKKKIPEEKRPRTAFTAEQLHRLKAEFDANRYLTEKRRVELSEELSLTESQIKIWFQNKRAKIKKSMGNKNPLALTLMSQGLYNHSTVTMSDEEEKS